jgi:hypothetical protein
VASRPAARPRATASTSPATPRRLSAPRRLGRRAAATHTASKLTIASPLAWRSRACPYRTQCQWQHRRKRAPSRVLPRILPPAVPSLRVGSARRPFRNGRGAWAFDTRSACNVPRAIPNGCRMRSHSGTARLSGSPATRPRRKGESGWTGSHSEDVTLVSARDHHNRSDGDR